MARQIPGITAWLVTWEADGDHAKPERVICAILSPYWSAERVRLHVEVLYGSSTFSADEWIQYARDREHIAYPAQLNNVHGVQVEDQVFCGGNPFLWARKVANLRVDPTDPNVISFSERPRNPESARQLKRIVDQVK